MTPLKRSCVEQHRCHEQGQGELGVERDGGDVREQREGGAGQSQQDGVRRVKPQRYRRQHGPDEQER
jgi:hypothetical protein